MARKVRTTFLYVVASVFFCASLYHHYLRDAISSFSSDQLRPSPSVISLPTSAPHPPSPTPTSVNYVFRQNLTNTTLPKYDSASLLIPSPSPSSPGQISTTAVLLPGWEVLVIVSPETTPSNLDGYSCFFDTNEVSPARYSGVLPYPDRATFSCLLPPRARRRVPFKQPILSSSPESRSDSPAPALIRWSQMVYDSLTTDEDIVLFVKGVNTRQGINREPREFRCVFGDDAINGVKTAVTSSMQEVFRCKRPQVTAVSPVGGVKISLEIVAGKRVVPSVAYYTPLRRLEPQGGRSLLCATTMVYDITKFLREWIVYHSEIGVEKFLLYDNGSDDDLKRVVDELVQDGFNISTYFWRWPKTQEAGFSHSALYAKDACAWMMYLDVDEFIFSPSWQNFSTPSKSLLQSLIRHHNSNIGQFSISCHEFGPSNQTVHPEMGVVQGYNCRRKYENRHKSIVLLDAVDHSMLNVIHHFHLRPGRKARKLSTQNMVVNHYKYQAWPEFKAKFRRRVSAYVLDWTDKSNPHSNDRTPGLGFVPVEPKGWPQKFCDVHDNRLKELTLRWFGIKSDSGFRMPWQR